MHSIDGIVSIITIAERRFAAPKSIAWLMNVRAR